MQTLYIVVLIIALLGLGGYYYRQYKTYLDEQDKKTWPEYIAPCPDYYVLGRDNKCFDAKNVRNNKSSSCQNIDFSLKLYTGPEGDLNKCRKAKECGISWEGIDRVCA